MNSVKKKMLVWIAITILNGLLVFTVARGQENPEVALRAAMETETVEGDLKSAIGQYQKIAKSVDRHIAVTALLRMAGCYEKLGINESRKIYERVLRDYADQKEAAQVARKQLEAQNPPVADAGVRVVRAGEEVFASGRVSPDGRFVVDTDWIYTGALILYDLVNGTERPLTAGDWDGPGNANSSTFSPDGSQIAFGWLEYEPRQPEIRIVDVEERGIPTPRTFYANKDLRWIDVTDWSSDGKWLAVQLTQKDNTRQIGIFGLETKELRILKSVDWRGPEKIFFSPNSRYLAYDLPASPSESQHDLFVMALDDARETSVAEHPAHDRILGWSPDGSQLLFASNRTGSIGFWAVSVTNGKPKASPRLLKPDMGSVYSFGLTASGALYARKDADTESLQLAPIDLDSGKLKGPPVVQDYRSTRPAWSVDGEYLGYRSRGSDGLLRISIRSTRTGEVRELTPELHYFNQPIWMPDSQSLMTFGRDFDGHDAIYRIDSKTGETSWVVDSRLNRVQVSADGKKLYFVSPERPFRNMELDLESGKTRVVFEVPSGSRYGGFELSPDGRYLAGVRQGSKTHPSSLVLISVSEGQERELLSVVSPIQIRAYGNITWTPDSQALIVVKSRVVKKGNLSSESEKELWLVRIEDGEVRKFEINIDDWNGGGNRGIRLNPDGDQIAFFAGKVSKELWVYENLLKKEIQDR